MRIVALKKSVAEKLLLDSKVLEKVDNAYSTSEALQILVDEARRRGFKVEVAPSRPLNKRSRTPGVFPSLCSGRPS